MVRIRYLALLSLFALAVAYESVDEEDDEEEAPMARAAAAISSTDLYSEHDVMSNKLESELEDAYMEGAALHGLGPYGPMDPMGHMMHSDMDDFPHHMDDLKHHHVDDYAHKMDKDYKAAAAAYPPFFPPPGPFPPMCPDVCDLSMFKKCTCLTPATFTKDGRGNCNVGASKMDLRVWCYINVKAMHGHPEQICPDAIPSKSKKGYYWSRIACITPS